MAQGSLVWSDATLCYFGPATHICGSPINARYEFTESIFTAHFLQSIFCRKRSQTQTCLRGPGKIVESSGRMKEASNAYPVFCVCSKEVLHAVSRRRRHRRIRMHGDPDYSRQIIPLTQAFLFRKTQCTSHLWHCTCFATSQKWIFFPASGV